MLSYAIDIILIIVLLALVIFMAIAIYDRFFQQKLSVLGNFPLLGRARYFFHELRPFFRQYFGDDNSWTPRIIIDWIRHVAEGKSGYFAFDKFDTTGHLHDGRHQMIHAPSPFNIDEMNPTYPVIGPDKKHSMQFNSYFYRSAMSLGSLSFEATTAMSKACADLRVAYNTGEGGLSIHHLPNLRFSFEKKFLKYKKLPGWAKSIYDMLPGIRLKNRWIEYLGNNVEANKGDRDLFLFDYDHWLMYTIDWDAPLEAFPKPEELTDEYGHIILQIGSGLYGMREKREDGKLSVDWERFAKTTSFSRAIEIKLAQGAKQTGGILKAKKNTQTISTIRGVHPGIDLVSLNRFPMYEIGKEEDFFEFLDKASTLAGGKPIGVKLVISTRANAEALIRQLSQTPRGKGIDFITVDGGDGGTGAAPIALGVLFGKKVYDALEIVINLLKEYGVRDRVKVFASSKLYAPHQSARAIALGADAVGLARSMMVAGGCIRAGLCSGEGGDCPIGMATMQKRKRRSYEQVWATKVEQIKNYLTAHDKGLVQVAAVAGVTSPSDLTHDHIADTSKKRVI
jgi:glutamate synthase domain-containing protein 2